MRIKPLSVKSSPINASPIKFPDNNSAPLMKNKSKTMYGVFMTDFNESPKIMRTASTKIVTKNSTFDAPSQEKLLIKRANSQLHEIMTNYAEIEEECKKAKDETLKTYQTFEQNMEGIERKIIDSLNVRKRGTGKMFRKRQIKNA